MRLHVLTDLHLEFQKWRRVWDIASIDCDAHVLAGDIGSGLTGLDFALRHFTKPVIYVAGNHEFYGQRPMLDWWCKAREKVAGSHVHLLENESVILDGVRFLGSTLWTDFKLFGLSRREELGILGEKESSDYRHIFLSRRGTIHQDADPHAFGFSRRRSGDRLTWKKVVEMHARSYEFLESELGKTGDWDQSVVVTHHAPTIASLEVPLQATDADATYASHLDHLVGAADYWIHGHTHCARDYTHPRGGRVIQNARGYKDSGIDSVPGFRWDFVVDTARPVPERRVTS